MSYVTSSGDLVRMQLFLKPTYAVIMPERYKKKGNPSKAQLKARENLKNNVHKGCLSKKSQRKLVNTVNWLVASAKEKTVFSKIDKTRYTFKLNFITLTLPTLDHGISDSYFKKKLLHNFINVCRYRYGLNNFVWKVEAQANGNIHAHFTTDTFVHWRSLRSIWNKILISHKIMDKYTQKFSQMSESDYIRYMQVKANFGVNKLKRMYKVGCNSGWKDPNTTDVKAVAKIRDIGAYLAKYMSKVDEKRRPISGRLWSCSYNLAKANKIAVSVPVDFDYSLFSDLFVSGVEWSTIDVIDKITKLPRKVGEIFFFKLSDWGSVIRGQLLTFYNEILSDLRQGRAPGYFDRLQESVIKRTVKEVKNKVTSFQTYMFN